MNYTNIKTIILQIESELQNISIDFKIFQRDPKQLQSEKSLELIERRISNLLPIEQERIKAEFFGNGPLASLFDDKEITEILVNGPFKICYEKNGCLNNYEDCFASKLSYRNFCHRLMEEAKIQLTSDSPIAQGNLKSFRIQMIGSELTQDGVHLSLRRHPENPWTFDKLLENGWGNSNQVEAIKKILSQKKNFLVIGGTGTGKTSVLNACLQELGQTERCVLIEDTLELKIANEASMRMLTRTDTNGILRTIQQQDLVKSALRLRPDRLVMGEIRGDEAKDFLMALSTGHSGSFGTLHAASAAQALIRLEMLVQMAAPFWSLQAIRRLIQLSLDYIVVIKRSNSGKRELEGLYRISSLEESGFLIEKI